MVNMKITETAPCRIDLAGGTLDLWPLYAQLGPIEVNHVAIKIFAKTQLEYKKSKSPLEINIESLDLNSQKTFSSLADLGSSLKQTPQTLPLRWICRIVFAELSALKKVPTGTLKIICSSETPPGSGLGGSSVLGVSIVNALRKAFKNSPLKKQTVWEKLLWIRDLESQEIETPAGEQDYLPALAGGMLNFKLGPGLRQAHRLPDSIAKKLCSRLALLYTGKPHHSGLNNWSVFKAYTEKDPLVKSSLESIRHISEKLSESLRNPPKNFWTEVFPSLLNEEWMERQKLSPSICPQVLKDAWSFGMSLGAVARKACGAGGGGCLLLYFADPAERDKAIATAFPNSDWKWLPVQLCPPKNSKKVL
jgi:D-glycero-alpha-D-manno-heptose-7-phosphate kinase